MDAQSQRVARWLEETDEEENDLEDLPSSEDEEDCCLEERHDSESEQESDVGEQIIPDTPSALQPLSESSSDEDVPLANLRIYKSKSASYYTIDIVETQQLNDTQDSSQEVLRRRILCITFNKLKVPKEGFHRFWYLTSHQKICLTETKKKNMNSISASIIKRKNQKQMNEETITTKILEILEAQLQNEHMKLERDKILLDLDIELKRNL
ncbi:unnamed protein product [Parnassius apollo]|uniref:(apollo) hypothetical protein n=1 Tax=Parnassius apollo TaxID=110799 RepID=A0A8S3WCH0_PARAO|nr:unnamed protein product [Parnassius apollo]